MIPIWKKDLDSKKIKRLINFSILHKHISEGMMTSKAEKEISKLLKVKHTVMVTSGTAALLIAMISIGLKENDTILIPERAWISVLNAATILKLKVITIDVKKDKPIIDENILQNIKLKVKAIVVVHIGGRACEMKKILKIAKNKKIKIIEDTAQAFGSKYDNKNLGTYGDIGCFSLSMAKTITSGQGGFLVTNKSELFEKIKKIKNNGLIDVMDIKNYGELGLNFKYTDIAASILLTELKRFKMYSRKMVNLYNLYKKDIISSSSFYVLDINLKKGELPQYIEIICKKRNEYIKYMSKYNIQCRKFYPSMSNSKFANSYTKKKLNDDLFSKNGVFLPAGTHQKLSDIKKVISLTNTFIKKNLRN